MFFSEMSRRYDKKRKILITLILFLFCFLFYRGLELHLRQSITDRIRFHAIPVAMSVLYHHHPHDYTGIRSIALPFQGSGSTESLMQAAKRQDIGQDQGNYYWVADDKGFEDYVIAAFYLFGPHLYSLYNMWFILLFLSVSLFLLSFRKEISSLGFLCLMLLGIHLAISTLPLSSLQLVKGIYVDGSTIYETRFLDVLALIPVIHMMLLAGRRRAVLAWAKDVLPLLGQILIFLVLYHSRSSLGWEIVAVFILCLSFFCFRVYRNVQKKRETLKLNYSFSYFMKGTKYSVVIISALLVNLLFLNVYKHIVYNSAYYREMGSRTFWHNALMGLAQDDQFYEDRYKLAANSDLIIARSVIQYANNTKLCSESVAKLEPQPLLNTLGGHGIANWSAYEGCAKSFYFSILADNKLRTLGLYGIHKPLASLSLLYTWLNPFGTSDFGRITVRSQVGWSPLSPINISIFLLIMLFSGSALIRARNKLLYGSIIIFISSFIPSVAFYHGVLSMGGFLVLASVLFYFALMLILKKLQSSLFKTKHINVVRQSDDILKKITIVIPAYNEETRIKTTIEEVYHIAEKILDDFEIIVVDDGSSDKTYAAALSVADRLGSKIKVYAHNINQGVGKAFDFGLKIARFEYLCLIPGDNAYSVSGIESLFYRCGDAPLVISYRNNMDARTPLRHLLSRIATFSLRLITGFRVRDAHSLYLFPVKETRALGIKAAGYGYHIEILSRLLKRLEFLEVPVTLNPKPDASSGVMKLGTLLILGSTIFKLVILRVVRRL